MLFLPATTSYSRMQIQMRDNGPQGSIIFDTEAQTLATANHLDCGNFDDMLRKAFEHENIDSAFKINGLTPIYIRFPMLAMFLTGTPSQMASLIETSEKGLPSRIMLYTFRSIPKWKPWEMTVSRSKSLSNRWHIVSSSFIISARIILYCFTSAVLNGII